jgi:putative two-component system hydrogenase maturation factor HypX/HoxX
LLPKRLGELASKDMMSKRLPLLATSALKMGLIDRCLKSHSISLEHDINEQAQALVLKSNLKILINEKQKARTMDELNKPLDDYRKEELFKMHRNFYGFDASYHVARFHFVHKLAHAWTPRHLAIHRL